MEKRLIYALRCPFTNDVHYVGKTITGMIRPLSHLRTSHSDKIKEWVDNLKELLNKPIVEILEYVSPDMNLDAREKHWIHVMLNKGYVLLNSNCATPIIINPNLDCFTDGDESNIKHISVFIKKKRKDVGLTQEEFAYKTGMSLKVLRKIEQGRTNVLLDSILLPLKMFGCTIDIKRINQISS